MRPLNPRDRKVLVRPNCRCSRLLLCSHEVKLLLSNVDNTPIHSHDVQAEEAGYLAAAQLVTDKPADDDGRRSDWNAFDRESLWSGEIGLRRYAGGIYEMHIPAPAFRARRFRKTNI